MAESFEDQVAIWKRSKVCDKFEIWEALDYQKILEDTNKNQSDESIDSYFEFILN